jgi:hypothetical protein
MDGSLSLAQANPVDGAVAVDIPAISTARGCL